MQAVARVNREKSMVVELDEKCIRYSEEHGIVFPSQPISTCDESRSGSKSQRYDFFGRSPEDEYPTGRGGKVPAYSATLTRIFPRKQRFLEKPRQRICLTKNKKNIKKKGKESFLPLRELFMNRPGIILGLYLKIRRNKYFAAKI